MKGLINLLMIKLENVTFKYDKVILDNINLEIDKSKVTVVIGHNGSGKSTLANLLSGIIYPKKGNIFIDDIKLNKHTDSKTIRKKIGLVFQNPNNQIIFSKVYEDILFTLENMKIPKDKIPIIIKDSLNRVGMSGCEEKNPYNLSGGEKQRIAIASIISMKPNYLIMDEATSMLDQEGKKDIYKLIQDLKKDMGIIFLTNNMEEIIYADDVLIINNNKVYKYSIEDIIKDNSIISKYDLEIPFILKLATSLNILDKAKIKEEFIIERIMNND